MCSEAKHCMIVSSIQTQIYAESICLIHSSHFFGTSTNATKTPFENIFPLKERVQRRIGSAN